MQRLFGEWQYGRSKIPVGLHGTFPPCCVCSPARKFQGAKVMGRNISTVGTFVPGNEWSWQQKVHFLTVTIINMFGFAGWCSLSFTVQLYLLEEVWHFVSVFYCLSTINRLDWLIYKYSKVHWAQNWKHNILIHCRTDKHILYSMPSAGAVIPPTIIPLRNPSSSGKPTSHIDTKTYIELESGMWRWCQFCFISLVLYAVFTFSGTFSTIFVFWNNQLNVLLYWWCDIMCLCNYKFVEIFVIVALSNRGMSDCLSIYHTLVMHQNWLT